jgi:hypothetical protein
MPGYDATLVVWKETAIKTLPPKLHEKCDPKKNLRLRVEMLATKKNTPDVNLFHVFDTDYSALRPLINVDALNNYVRAYNPAARTHYYSVENLEPEEFIKRGHLFVQELNEIIKSPSAAFVHGAVVGLNGKGVLFCARGQRGKSTLAVKAMLDGFDFVSDDYLILSKEGGNLYSYPIYSIITLSPRMYNELYYELKGKFVSNNARKDKYVINIADYHDRFRRKYPISVCVFPQIAGDAEPSIVRADKGRSIVQLVHSTINQTGDRHDIESVKKLMGFVKDFEFYQINLCKDIDANVKCLRKFIEGYKNTDKEGNRK